MLARHRLGRRLPDAGTFPDYILSVMNTVVYCQLTLSGLPL